MLAPSKNCVAEKNNDTIKGKSVQLAGCPVGLDVSYTPLTNEANQTIEKLRNEGDIGLIFPNLDFTDENAVVSYTIRMHAKWVPTTSNVLPPQKLGDEDFKRVGPNEGVNIFFNEQISIK